MTRIFRNKRSGKMHLEKAPSLGILPGVAECGATVRKPTYEQVEIIHDKYAPGGHREPCADDVTCWQCLDISTEYKA